MNKADSVRQRTRAARADLAARARQAANEEYPRSIMARIEMELSAGNDHAVIEPSKAGSVHPSAYFARIAELAKDDGFTTHIHSNGAFVIVISWKEEEEEKGEEEEA